MIKYKVKMFNRKHSLENAQSYKTWIETRRNTSVINVSILQDRYIMVTYVEEECVG